MTLIHRLFCITLMSFLYGVEQTHASFLEDFETNPVTGGRFTQLTQFTESDFTYDQANGNLLAVLDNDNSPAFYLSSPIPTVTDQDFGFFRANVRFKSTDVAQDIGVGLFGLMTQQHMNDFGSGLAAGIAASSDGKISITARADAGASNNYGNSFTLSLDVDYLLIGIYSPITRFLSVQAFQGSTLVGTSTASLPSNRSLSVNKIGFQNNGRITTDRTGADSITFMADNISTVPEISDLGMLACLTPLILVFVWRRSSPALALPDNGCTESCIRRQK